MTNELLHRDLCPLCSHPMWPEFRSVGRSAQQDHPARTDFHRYHCDSCEATRTQEFHDAMRALYEN
jgi:transposase-like protein